MPMRIAILVLAFVSSVPRAGAAEPIPHGQTEAPNAPLTPSEAVARMTLPDGFKAEVVACEPDIVNPVAMTFDDRGRIWITESLEYPRRAPGAGRDRVKILEDTDGDGKADKFTVFADGLNIPSGIAVGHGGVWVANSPDILFLQDTDGDGMADKREVVVTGFGRFDTHELPNSLTWGPDGWLYGWNGVFNRSRIDYRGKSYDFTCAIFRIHPRTRDFELFCEGTSNPWGIAWNLDGEAFASACVIDHLWHLSETGYYHRQGGPYPPHTWKIESIVDHSHQKAAYCGIHFFDSDAYPPEYRERLYMGNIHGNCLNVDRLERNGSTYKGIACPDFLSANDAWFMPVSQKTGPDGCLYVLDWYDRYHCYQDANRDPAGIDRLKGRLYRIRYRDNPRRGGFNLATADDRTLIRLLASPNVYDRDSAQRLLTERNAPANRAVLESMVLDANQARKARMHALWVLVGTGRLDAGFHGRLLAHADAAFRAWGVRAAGDMKRVEPVVREKLVALAHDPAPEVLVQVAIAARKVEGVDPLPVLADVLSSSGTDSLIPHIVWQNLHPLLDERGGEFARLITPDAIRRAPNLVKMLPRVLERILTGRRFEPDAAVRLLSALAAIDTPESRTAIGGVLASLASLIHSQQITPAQLAALRQALAPVIERIRADGGSRRALPGDDPLRVDAELLAAAWRDPKGLETARDVLAAGRIAPALRLRALDALLAADTPAALESVSRVFREQSARGTAEFRGELIAALGKIDDPRIAAIVLDGYALLEPENRPKAIELLTQRPAWSRALLKAIAAEKVSANALNVNQIRKLLGSKDAELVKQARAIWGSVRETRNPERERIIAEIRQFLDTHPGDPRAGQKVFRQLCAQCHKIYGEGQEVGPEITLNGRGSYEQLLSNVLDPSLVIGGAYQATVVATTDGRVLTGLLVEDSPQRVVLKLQGGKLETIARDDVDAMKVSLLSLMPEDLEKQLKPEELADLFAFITLDKPAHDPTAKPLPGADHLHVRASTNPEDFPRILNRVAPGFRTAAVGEGGLAIVAAHFGKSNVLRTHPIDRDVPCVLESTVVIPPGKRTRLEFEVAHDPRGDWRLVVKANGKTLHEETVGPSTTREGWKKVSLDLTPFAGQSVRLELLNQANGWSWEFGYWGRIQVVSE